MQSRIIVHKAPYSRVNAMKSSQIIYRLDDEATLQFKMIIFRKHLSYKTKTQKWSISSATLLSRNFEQRMIFIQERKHDSFVAKQLILFLAYL